MIKKMPQFIKILTKKVIFCHYQAKTHLAMLIKEFLND